MVETTEVIGEPRKGGVSVEDEGQNFWPSYVSLA